MLNDFQNEKNQFITVSLWVRQVLKRSLFFLEPLYCRKDISLI